MNQIAQLSWQYHSPTFEYNELFDDSLWPWVGHRSFAYDYVYWAKPKVIVELGTHKGTSFFSMAQAVKDAGLSTQLIAVDSWEGDPHANYYGDDVYLGVQQIKQQCYPQLDITLHKMYFDQALSLVADGSVDLLHIDGFHSLEAVQHDYLSWLPKLSPRATVFFHDTHEYDNNFGVHRLWKKLKKTHATVEFSHSHGLGVLINDQSLAEGMLKESEMFKTYYELKADTALEIAKWRALATEQRQLSQAVLEAQQRVNDLQGELKLITNGTFFKTWQKFHRWRDRLRRVRT